TLFNGKFGFGWCSEFETSLEITPEGNLRYLECGAGQEITYLAPNFSAKDVDQSVKTILEKMKTENTSANAAYFVEMSQRLRSEPSLRAEYAAKYGLTRSVADKSRFYADGNETDYVEKVGSNFVHTTPEGSTQKFRMDGHLEKVYDKNGNYLSF